MSNKPDREEGIDAIIFLQRMGGVTETRESASIAWALASTNEQRQILELYNNLKGNPEFALQLGAELRAEIESSPVKASVRVRKKGSISSRAERLAAHRKGSGRLH